MEIKDIPRWALPLPAEAEEKTPEDVIALIFDHVPVP